MNDSFKCDGSNRLKDSYLCDEVNWSTDVIATRSAAFSFSSGDVAVEQLEKNTQLQPWTVFLLKITWFQLKKTDFLSLVFNF